ncbi:MAG TPA: F420H(2):quinone oxidoreductase [Methanophagales archaeon]|nr:F420H(2):quinone oxidoreductase [Methanophagales archaeon]
MATAIAIGESEWEVAVPEKPLKDKTYFENLKAKVIDTNLCSRCLTCAAICPGGITVVGNKVDFPDYEDNCLDCGACVRVCPRFVYEPKSGLGDYIEFIAGRSKRFAGQDGAMVTELLVSAIEMGMIDRGLFAGRDEKWATEMFHVREPEQLAITTLGGTKYTFADVLPALKEAVGFTKRGVGIVGTPCIVSGVRKLQQEYPIFRERVKLVVGLFCTENFHYDDITKFLQEKGVDFSKLVKTDIIKGKFISTMTDGKVKFKVAEAEDIIASGCNVCTDFTAVESDASVGSVGSEKGFSTVAVREENAKKVIDFIKEKGYADFGEADTSQLDFLIGHKKKREENIKR